MGGISIGEALARVQAPQLKVRKEALSDLKHVLGHNRRNAGLKILSDRNYLELLKNLFDGIRVEKSNYLKNSRGGEERLASCADALRIIVEHGVETFGRKHTSPALLSHILLTLPSSNGRLCEPISKQYAKVLRIFLEHRPHAEHLIEEEWRELVSLCLKAVQSKLDLFEDQVDFEDAPPTPNVSRGPGRNSRAGTPTSINISFRSAPKSARRQRSVLGDQTTEDLLVCLSLLLSVPHFPILDVGNKIYENLQAFLADTPPSTHLQCVEPAFFSVNAILSSSITEDLAFAKRVVLNTIPEVRRLWHPKLHHGLKEQMLLFVICCEQLLQPVLSTNDNFKIELHRLFDVLNSEYVKRKDLDLLTCDDLGLGQPGPSSTVAPMANTVFRLRLGTPRTEQCWATLRLSARLFRLLRDGKGRGAAATNLAPGTPNKRRKVQGDFDLVLDSVKKSSGSEKLGWLQIASFMALAANLTVDELQRLCELVLPLVPREDGNIASWALIVLSCVSDNIPFNSHDFSAEFWSQCWKIAARAITSLPTCRAACHTLACLVHFNLVEYQQISETMDSMLSSVDLSGPSLLCDSSASLWSILLDVKSAHAPVLVYQASRKIIQWLSARWRPSIATESKGAKRAMNEFGTEDIMLLLAGVLSLPKIKNHLSKPSEMGILSTAQVNQMSDDPLIEYLLSTAKVVPAQSETQDKITQRQVTAEFSDSRFQDLCNEVFSLLGTEARSILSTDGLRTSSSSSSAIVEEVFRTTTQLGIVSLALISNARVQRLAKFGRLRDDVEKIQAYVMEVIPKLDEKGAAIDGVLAAFGNLLIYGEGNLERAGAHAMASAFTPDFWQKLAISEDDSPKDDLLIVEESLDSQSSLGRSETQDTSRSRRLATEAYGVQRLKTNQIARVCLASSITYRTTDGTFDKRVEDSFFDYITQLKARDFISCRDVLLELFDAKVLISATATSTLLEYLGQELLGPDEFERCDNALSLVLEIMAGLSDVWVPSEGDLQSVAMQLYEWFLRVALPKRILSPNARVCMANMLKRVLQLKPDYTKEMPLESTRTSLLRIFEEGTAKMKYLIGKQISSIFKYFILKEHETILEDILSSLPLEPEWTEGSAMRIYVLAKLGGSWSTLLRQCIYAIVEASALVPTCSDHARICFQQLSRDLGIQSPKALFKLFGSQIIYTWLSSNALSAIPFEVVGYSSLGDLLIDIQSEVTAQVFLRGRESEAKELAQHCRQSWDDLLKKSFSRAVAYSAARDASVPPDRDERAAHAIARLTKIMGTDQFRSHLTSNLPEILSILFKIADREESISKGFQKNNTFSAASHAYDEILSSGASQTPLIVSQQPSFKASYLLDEIEFLCNQAGQKPEIIWSAALYTYIFRELLGSTHPALGSLHTASVVRRLRILVSMAGESALQDYPLEMTLHSLRQFLTDTQCSEDILGLSKYLISHGFDYLQQAPSFFTGFVVSTLVSLRAFLESPRDSTTQESQYIATMSKAQEFHEWLGNQISTYSAPALSAFDTQLLRRLVHTAVKVRSAGSSRLDTPESDLLSMILEDDQSGRKLIDRSSRRIILDVLCSEFDFSCNFRDDILGNDTQAVRSATALLSTTMSRRTESNYKRWVARVLGRAQAATGKLDGKDFEQDPMGMDIRSLDASTSNISDESRTSILQFLSRMLYADSLREIGSAEKALRSIFSTTRREAALSACLEDLAPTLQSAFSWNFSLDRQKTIQSTVLEDIPRLTDALGIRPNLPYSLWIRDLCLALAGTCSNDPLLSAFIPILRDNRVASEHLFPQILHLALIASTGKQNVKASVSAAASQWLVDFETASEPHVRQLFKAVLYLRTQAMPQESTKSDRMRWLDIDLRLGAEVAANCGMFTTSLLFLEMSFSEAPRNLSRRSSVNKLEVPQDLLVQIYQNLDDKDLFYGIKQPSSLQAMMSQLEFENAGFKSLSFRGAYYDSQIRQRGAADQASETDIIKLLDAVNLNGVSQALLSTIVDQSSITQEAMFMTARKLERWDITGPSDMSSPSTILFKAFQNLHDGVDFASISSALDLGFQNALSFAMSGFQNMKSLQRNMSTLAVLTEIEDVVYSRGTGQLLEVRDRFGKREEWMLLRSYEDMNTLDSCRQTLFSTLSKSRDLQSLMRISEKDARITEVQTILASSSLNRRHGATQSSLNSATYLAQLVDSCADLGVRVDAAAGLEASNVLWDHGEMASSIRMLQDIAANVDLKRQDILVGRPKILATLGHRISEARLEKPDEVIANYLGPAIAELKGTVKGAEAGQVFHEFASFCDKQLQNPDALEDFKRVELLRARKEAEIKDLDSIAKSGGSQQKERDVLKHMRTKAKKWFDLDNREYQRLREERRALLSQSLENYLLCLQASDEYDNDVLRFSALWLEYSEEEAANAAVKKQLKHVASRKFANLIHQWTSRQLDKDDEFQSLLSALILRICSDHPFHGMYHLFTSSKSRGVKDHAALSRNAAALKVVSELKTHPRTGPTWIAVHNSNVNYVRFATERMEKAKQGMKMALSQTPVGRKLEQDIRSNNIPPPTMKIELRPDCDYSSIPTIHKYSANFAFASGISMPKIVTAVASDGRKYKQLFKSGNDDLRQDAVMEQVFEQVSNLLKQHRETRQRNLGIRTYKVLPLTATTGIIEWVTDTIPLNDYLMPAHQAHYPRDLKQSACRKAIADAQNKSTETRVKTFREVCEKFHPVLRYFFMDRFMDPDEWFERRLMYTRSTAAISMLGYILGLGDRHGQNILLDEKTGEVVHIDLGIAFETGRVLPVPEVVPFRLTRDIVDGMGITKTEGVFRRCCEFTLDALRKEEYSIMTILDVLRYDPLVSWSVSPLRMKRMQEDQEEVGDEDAEGRVRAQREEGGKAGEKDEEGEAERALTVVKKKLSKSLSVAATVNELIQQATDERNLALLFAGWAAYA